MTLVVILTVRADAVDAFRAYERATAVVMAKHGGAIERVVVVPPADDSAPFVEIHIVTFPDAAAFAAYRRDPELLALTPARAAAVEKTEIFVGHDGPLYHQAGD